jgi:hypothetical protein
MDFIDRQFIFDLIREPTELLSKRFILSSSPTLAILALYLHILLLLVAAWRLRDRIHDMFDLIPAGIIFIWQVRIGISPL